MSDTLTDDEREALSRVLTANFFYADEDPSVQELADAVLAAGFRRSEVPEPTAALACPHWAEGKVTMRKGCTACEAEGRVPEPSRQIRECAVCGEKVTMSNATEAWEKRHEHTEPQGKPSDANAGAGWFEWFKMPENTTEIAYVHENGDVFDPVRGWNPAEFTIAAAEGKAHRLVRAAARAR